MAPQELPQNHLIEEIINSKGQLSNARLTQLSNLEGKNLPGLEQLWNRVEVTRRRQLASQLADLSEADVKLDFTGVFVLFLDDPDEAVRMKAISGLEAEENYRLIEPLLKAMKQDSSVRVRAAAASALSRFALMGELGKLSARYTGAVSAALLQVLDDKTEAAEVRRRALESIAPLTSPRVKELIEEAYHSSNLDLKVSSIHAMGRTCDRAWLKTLLAELDSDQAEIRYEAVNALAELGAGESIPLLIEATEDGDAQVEEAAIRALGAIGGDQAEQALNRLAEDPEPHIRLAAETALKELHFCEDPLSLDL